MSDIDDWLEKGKKLIDEKKYDEAIACFNEALKLDADNAHTIHGKTIILNHKASYYEDTANYDEAIACYDEILKLIPDYGRIEHAKQEALRRKNVYYGDILNLNPSERKAKNSNELFLDDKYTNADIDVFAYFEAIKLNPENPRVWYNMGKSLYHNDLYDEAIICFDVILKLNPKHSDAWNGIGWALIGKRNHILYYENFYRGLDASSCFSEAIALNPFNSEALCGYGTTYYTGGQCNGTPLPYYNSAILLNPDNYTAWYNKGRELEQFGDYHIEAFNDAISCYDEVIRIIPNNSRSAWYDKERVYEKMGLHDKAKACYEMAKKLKPNDSDEWHDKEEKLKSNDFFDVFTCYDEAIKLSPYDPWIWYKKGELLRNKALYDKALVCYNEVLKLEPDNSDAWHSKGSTLSRKDLYDEAEACFKKAGYCYDKDFKSKKSERIKYLIYTIVFTIIVVLLTILKCSD